jgi:hypothetical protein
MNVTERRMRRTSPDQLFRLQKETSTDFFLQEADADYDADVDKSWPGIAS